MINISRHSLSGIGARVNLVFAAISSIMLIVMLLSWLAFEELGAQINEINEVRVPSLSKTINLFSIADDFLNMGPKLSASTTDRDRQATYARMSVFLNRLSKLNEIQSNDGGEIDNHQRIDELIEHLYVSLTLLNSSAQYKLRIKHLKQEKLNALNQDYGRFQASVTDVMSHSDLSTLLRQIIDIERIGQKFFETLSHLSEFQTKVEIDKEETTLRELGQQLLLKDHLFTPSLRETTQKLVTNLKAENNLVTLRLKQIDMQLATTRELEKAHVKIVQLRLILTLNMKKNQDAIAMASQDARKLITSRTAQLALSVAIVVALSFIASLIFVRRSLIHRLMQLGSKMDSIAQGKLDTDIDTSGNDEITRMAEALEVFRTTAREVEEQQTRAIIESSVAGLVMTNATGDIEFLSHTARTLFGYEEFTQDTLPELKIIDFVIPIEGNLLSEMLDECRIAIEKGENISLNRNVSEFNSLCRDAKTFPSDIAVRAIRQRTGLKFIFTIYDVSERKLAQQKLEQTVTARTAELSQANYELQQENKTRIETERTLRNTKEELVQASKLAALGKMASGISHEFNQPLMAISSWLHNVDILLERGELNEAEDALNNIGTQVNRMVELASHLQTLARQPVLTFSSTDVAGIIERALSLFQVQISQEGAVIENVADLKNLSVTTDGLRLEQVFINLISNALDATRNQKRKILSFGVDTTRENQLSISLCDNGPGISEETIEHVFDPFFTTKEVGKGMGLGLSISYNIVRTLGGSLSVCNRDTGGACFTLTLSTNGINSQTPFQAEEIW